jgi:hypothetical protein
MQIEANRYLTKREVEFLKSYKEKIQRFVIPFYVELERTYALQPGSSLSYETSTERRTSSQLVESINKLLQTGRGDEATIVSIYKQANESVQHLKFYQDQAKKDNELNLRLREVSQKTKTDLDKLIQEQGRITNRFEKLNQKDSVGETALWAGLFFAAAPLAVAAKPLWDIGKYAYGKIKDRNLRKQAERFSLKDVAKSKTESLPSVQSGLPGIGQTDDIDGGVNWPGRDPRTGRYISRKSRPGIPIAGSTDLKKTILGDAVNLGLNKFFTTSAYKVKWTKELLEAVQGKGPTPKDERKKAGISGLGGLGNIFKGLGSMVVGAMKLIGPALAVAAAAYGGWKVGRWLGENVKWGGKSLDQHVESGILGMIGGDVNDRLRRKIPGTKSPLARRALELQVEKGMSVEDSIALAQVELGKVTPKEAAERKIAKERSANLGAAPKDVGSPGFDVLGAASKMAPMVESLASGIETGETLGEKKSTIEDLESIDFMKASEENLQGITSRLNKELEKIPIEEMGSKLEKTLSDVMGKLEATMGDVGDTLKAGSKTTSQKLPSGYDANNTRNPILSSLGAGLLDIA